MHSLVAVATAAVSSTPSATPRLGFDRASRSAQARTDVVGRAAGSRHGEADRGSTGGGRGVGDYGRKGSGDNRNAEKFQVRRGEWGHLRDYIEVERIGPHLRD